MSKELEEATLLEALKSSQDSIEFKKAANIIYKNYKPRITAWLQKNHRLQEAGIDEITHRTLGAFLQNLRKGKYRGEGKIFTYLVGIASNQVKSFMTQKGKKVLLDQILQDIKEENTATPEQLFISKELKGQVNQLLERLGKRCRMILRLWMDSYNFKEIAAQLNYSSAGGARVAKGRCMEELKLMVKKYPGIIK